MQPLIRHHGYVLEPDTFAQAALAKVVNYGRQSVISAKHPEMFKNPESLVWSQQTGGHCGVSCRVGGHPAQRRIVVGRNRL
jgi:hypothetical protein